MCQYVSEQPERCKPSRQKKKKYRKVEAAKVKSKQILRQKSRDDQVVLRSKPCPGSASLRKEEPQEPAARSHASGRHDRCSAKEEEEGGQDTRSGETISKPWNGDGGGGEWEGVRV